MAQADEPSRGSGNFQQKIIRDRIPPLRLPAGRQVSAKQFFIKSFPFVLPVPLEVGFATGVPVSFNGIPFPPFLKIEPSFPKHSRNLIRFLDLFSYFLYDY
ncbi:MAG: hypothetical protein UY47_C0004G0053 [Parcubacteria group bacterium GW2011_GWB1_49_7]|uniref:Uncharacterized protein n=1 Tax=Candidatus Zambryskibacteria bacterium RIFCSPHIGHO2_01_FULL_46_25 TaxID=1802738 RepID=A0A1G2T053_9BACT|nr:MAG: hypothetical protein UX71_C0002G0058 [Parcubacteria group bacterium GW2011_GWA1_47_10]KKW09879.1 MAG: hypothetical protein UY47_C0004G0053 [Parcubacteria group bacterium GW2011_GWB1_49_7]OHA90653.1 MAG: hypothetical protein A2838_02970 [Candidatus Zambryskibacteria bacterium RIFCSPHIGHO2_01_FULL_46_25]OHB00598.1 MAG: hypothetical protein A3F53_02020 [Candidatus Zambryskibacteria bacterium RIFCSPHIGHO2_12_FULL_48_10]OHB07296.1 MAG: hypothetical protein A3A31_02110 [Candidatus Zambryskiba